MADIYVRSTDGNDADDGSTWALAKAKAITSTITPGSGDRVFLSSAHNETTAAAIAVGNGSTGSSTPAEFLSVDDSAEPPTTLAAGAIIQNSSSIISISSDIYCWGVDFRAQTEVACNPTGVSTVQYFENCKFRTKSGTFGHVTAGTTGTVSYGTVTFKDCEFSFFGTLHGFRSYSGNLVISGGRIASDSAAISTLVRTWGHSTRGGGNILIENFDMSNAATGLTILPTGVSGNGLAIVRNCKLPSGWTGDLASTISSTRTRMEMHACDDGDRIYRMRVFDTFGSVRDDTLNVRSGGASDGATPISWKLATSFSAGPQFAGIRTPDIVRWNDVTGSSITVSVETLTDGITLNNEDCWLEVLYYGNSGFTLGEMASNRNTSRLAAATSHPTSGETWDTTGLTSPVKQTLSVTFTPQEAGYLVARVHFCVNSAAMFLCPKLEVA